MNATEYLDENGAFVFVSCGISQGEVWLTVRQRTSTSGTKRIKSPRLPIRGSREEAQQDLDAYAKSKGWQVFDPVQSDKKPESQLLPKAFRIPEEKQVELCGRCLILFSEAFPFYQITKGEVGIDKCGNCGQKTDVVTCLYSRKKNLGVAT